MGSRPVAVLLMGALLGVAALPTRLVAQEWLTQTYAVSARLEADLKTLEHPGRSSLTLVVPADLPDAEVCVDASGSRSQERGRTRVRVFGRRAEGGSGQIPLPTLEFEWRESDPPLPQSRCQAIGDLLAGDLLEYRFRFFDMPPLRLLRRGRRITTLPVLTVTGWVRHDPFTG